jgi:hypothetical protein
VQGGEPKDTEDYYLVEEQGIRLWIQNRISFKENVVRLERYMTTSGPVVIAVNALAR